MIEEPLTMTELRAVAARKAWDAFHMYQGQDPASAIPPEFYLATELIIKESYKNVDKMVSQAVRSRLENLLQ